jgi:ABC-type multidrug transport system fused ATPase/permease subunit
VIDEQGLRPMVLLIGLDFQVGTGGSRLAAPDRQKVAIGRALLKRPTILVLDQATAVLDPQAQIHLLESVLQSRDGRAVFWVLNRAELASKFDQVLVLERGQLVESGRFDELAARQGHLHQLLKSG